MPVEEPSTASEADVVDRSAQTATHAVAENQRILLNHAVKISAVLPLQVTLNQRRIALIGFCIDGDHPYRGRRGATGDRESRKQNGQNCFHLLSPPGSKKPMGRSILRSILMPSSSRCRFDPETRPGKQHRDLPRHAAIVKCGDIANARSPVWSAGIRGGHRAHKIDDLAAAQGGEEAQKARELIAELMTPDQIAEAQRMAREWMAKHKQ